MSHPTRHTLSWLALVLATTTPSATANPPATLGELQPLFGSTLAYYNQLQRTPDGLYRDSYLPRQAGRPNHHCSIAAVGIGLIALCATHESGTAQNTAQMALQTLNALNGKAAGFTPSRGPAGFFQHFFSDVDGAGYAEFSTIDTAIAVTGALFCRNTFDDPAITREADALWNSVDWQLALAKPDGSHLHMVFENGKPKKNTVTKLFSEYFLLACLIERSQLQKNGHSNIVTIGQLPTWNDAGIRLLGDGRSRPQPSFLVQFPFYMANPCTNDPLYRSHVAAQAKADYRASSGRLGAAHLWGCGAGVTPAHGYHAASYSDNPGNLVSPSIIAGFMPVFPAARDHLLTLYRNSDRRLDTPAGPLLPRFSIDHPGWRPHAIEAIDYASMLFGLVAIHPDLGMKFFNEKSAFTFNR